MSLGGLSQKGEGMKPAVLALAALIIIIVWCSRWQASRLETLEGEIEFMRRYNVELTLRLKDLQQMPVGTINLSERPSEAI